MMVEQLSDFIFWLQVLSLLIPLGIGIVIVTVLTVVIYTVHLFSEMGRK